MIIVDYNLASAKSDSLLICTDEISTSLTWWRVV